MQFKLFVVAGALLFAAQQASTTFLSECKRGHLNWKTGTIAELYKYVPDHIDNLVLYYDWIYSRIISHTNFSSIAEVREAEPKISEYLLQCIKPSVIFNVTLFSEAEVARITLQQMKQLTPHTRIDLDNTLNLWEFVHPFLSHYLRTAGVPESYSLNIFEQVSIPYSVPVDSQTAQLHMQPQQIPAFGQAIPSSVLVNPQGIPVNPHVIPIRPQLIPELPSMQMLSQIWNQALLQNWDQVLGSLDQNQAGQNQNQAGQNQNQARQNQNQAGQNQNQARQNQNQAGQNQNQARQNQNQAGQNQNQARQNRNQAAERQFNEASEIVEEFLAAPFPQNADLSLIINAIETDETFQPEPLILPSIPLANITNTTVTPVLLKRPSTSQIFAYISHTYTALRKVLHPVDDSSNVLNNIFATIPYLDEPVDNSIELVTNIIRSTLEKTIPLVDLLGVALGDVVATTNFDVTDDIQEQFDDLCDILQQNFVRIVAGIQRDLYRTFACLDTKYENLAQAPWKYSLPVDQGNMVADPSELISYIDQLTLQ